LPPNTHIRPGWRMTGQARAPARALMADLGSGPLWFRSYWGHCALLHAAPPSLPRILKVVPPYPPERLKFPRQSAGTAPWQLPLFGIRNHRAVGLCLRPSLSVRLSRAGLSRTCRPLPHLHPSSSRCKTMPPQPSPLGKRLSSNQPRRPVSSLGPRVTYTAAEPCCCLAS
jgi:hypothetical protein